MFKKSLIFLLVFVNFIFLSKTTFAQNLESIYLFYGRGCPHCAEVEEYFEKNNLFKKYPIEKKEIYFNRENAIFFNDLLDKLGIDRAKRGVPLVIIQDKVLIGDKPIIDNFVYEADKYLKEASVSPEKTTNTAESPTVSPTFSANKNEATISPANQKINNIESQGNLDLTLPVVLGASAVDAINPCAFAVLIILMSTILATGDGVKALKAGIAFASSIFISYFLMGLGLYQALALGGVSGLFFNIIGWLALILGIANLKDYFWYGKGFLMEVPLSWRPKLKKLIKSITSPIGAFGIGFLVSLFLLPCTSGPYIVILGMLAKKSLQTRAILYLILYNFVFVSPMILISFAVYKGFDIKKAEEVRQKRLRILHLIAGIIMLVMGVVILGGWI